MKFRLLIASLLFITKVHAFESLYAGTCLGETDVKFISTDLAIDSADIRYQGFSGRYFVGIDLSNKYGMELGFLHAKRIGILNINNSGTDGAVSVNGYSLLAKFRIDINKRDVFLFKFGASYVSASPDTRLRALSKNHYSWPRVSHYRPTVELGISRRFFNSFDFGLSMHYCHAHRVIPRVILIGLNFSLVIDKRFI